MAGPTNRAGSREWFGLAVLTLPVLLISIDVSVLFIALPALTADLSPTSSQLLWILDIYAFLLSGLLLTMGTLGDRIGRRRLLMFGAVAFGGASVVAAYASTAEMLIAARALQGIGGATLMPSTLSLIRNMFHDDNQRRSAIGVWTASVSAGMVLGPLVGGALLENFWWGSVFIINAPIMVLLLVVGLLVLPEFKAPQAGRFDLLSSLLSLLTVLPVIYGIKTIAEDGGASVVAVATILAGLLFGLIFVQRQRRRTDPMIDVRLFRNPAFSTALLTNLSVFVAMAGITLFTTQYLQIVLGMSPFRAGLWALTGAAASAVGATLGPVVVRWVRQVYVLVFGLVLAGIGFVILLQLGTDTLAIVIAGNVVAAAGIGFVVTMVVDMVVAAAPPERAGAASALSETCTEFGGALGIAVLGSIGGAVYRNQFLENAPAGLPPELTAASAETLAAAKGIAATVPEYAGQLVAVADAAFVESAHAMALTAAGLVAVMAVAALLALRRVRVPDPTERAEDEVHV
ncbi:MFS transporter [Micromonospora sp. FIMYZ51]|uniref:MFS transporter n=1 Tax=Micromonospora sp. FIMYZ51 TaxID=3051832 RepID=UPI00311E9D26